MKRYIADIIIVAIFFFLSLWLTGCSKTEPASHTVANGAKETITAIVVTKPGCQDVGTVCNRQIDAIVASCDLESEKLTTEKTHWQWSFWGLVGLVLLYIARKILK